MGTEGTVPRGRQGGLGNLAGRHALRLPLRRHPSSRTAVDLPQTDGIEGAVDLRPVGRRSRHVNAVAITPYLYYEDVGAALKWLAKAFGLKRAGPAMRGLDGRINHAAMKLGGAMVMMGGPGKAYKNPRHLGHATQSLYVNVPNVDTHFTRASKAG